MHISELKLWNFRKYGGEDFDLTKPHLVVPFKKGMNVLIGENDSGKTAIIDSNKYVLKDNVVGTPARIVKKDNVKCNILL